MSLNQIVYDRLKEAMLALFGMSTPRIDFYTKYRAVVVKQSPDATKVDLKPDDPRIPQCSDVPIKWGIPGVKATFAPGTAMMLGWENGDPALRYAALIEDATVTKLVLNAQAVYLGVEAGAKKLATEDHTHTFAYNGGPTPATGTTAPTTPDGLTTITSAG